MTLSQEIDQNLYARVIALVEKYTKQKNLKPETRLFQDLGVDGMDADNLLAKFRDEFNVDFTNFVFDKHFGPEAGWNPFLWLYWMLCEREKLNKNCSAIKVVPITLLDLYQAAKERKFPDLTNRTPE